jgi:malonate-semialdehyde dehydrogenase (acetylating)/methylmalonate-semialdehyde dehydrogenase
MIPLWMFPMAIVCGNTFVLKPSEQDPLTPMLLAELALEAGVPPGVLNIIHGGKRAVDAICTHPDIVAVSFVGSTAVGTHVYTLASQHGKRVQCMMGAKNHAVVMPDANKEQSLNALVGSTFGAAGQRCMATSVTVLVGEAQKWIPDIVAKAKTLKVNAGMEKGADLGPVVSKNAKHRILGLVEDGIKEGAKLELDGRAIKVQGYEQGNFIGPTIFSAVKPGMKIYTTEIFGPVMVIVGVNTLDEAIKLVNDNPFGNGVSYPNFRDLQSKSQSFEGGRPALHLMRPLFLHRLARFQARRLGTLRQAGGAVLYADQNRDHPLVRRQRHFRRREHDHQPEVTRRKTCS